MNVLSRFKRSIFPLLKRFLFFSDVFIHLLQVSVAELLARLTAVWEDPGSIHATDSSIYRDIWCDIQSWARAVHLYCSA